MDEGHIEIRVRAEGEDVLFTVEDNGVGMEPEQIEEIFRRKPDGKSGIGIKNVNDRLKIWFGDAYGITIESVPDEGTKRNGAYAEGAGGGGAMKSIKWIAVFLALLVCLSGCAGTHQSRRVVQYLSDRQILHHGVLESGFCRGERREIRI